jgi:hypothetical protein
MARGPIILDFPTGRLYRADNKKKDLAETMRMAASKSGSGRVVKKTMEGMPAHVLTRQQPKT